ASDVVDLATGTRRPLAVTEWNVTLVPRQDVVAVVTTSTAIEFRRLDDGALVRTLAVPEPREKADRSTGGEIVFAAAGDRLALQLGGGVLLVCDLAKERWTELGVGWPIGFTPTGLAWLAFDKTCNETRLLVSGAAHELLPPTHHDERTFALAASGER